MGGCRFAKANVALFALAELPRNQTQVILLDENHVPIKPQDDPMVNKQNGERKQLHSSSGDVKGFHRKGEESPYDKRYGINGSSKVLGSMIL